MIAAVPFVDVINTMLDETIPLTTFEFDEWGNPKDKAYFDYIMQYSPYDNVEAKDYPHTSSPRVLGQSGAVLGAGQVDRQASRRQNR